MSNWAVLELAVAVAIVLPLAPTKDQLTNLCSSRSTTICVSPFVKVIPTRVIPLCVLLTTLCFVLVFVLLHLVISFLLILSVLFALPFAVVLAFALARLVGFALYRLAFGFVVRARPFTRLIVLHVFSFLSTRSRHVTHIPHHEQFP